MEIKDYIEQNVLDGLNQPDYMGSGKPSDEEADDYKTDSQKQLEMMVLDGYTKIPEGERQDNRLPKYLCMEDAKLWQGADKWGRCDAGHCYAFGQKHTPEFVGKLLVAKGYRRDQQSGQKLQSPIALHPHAQRQPIGCIGESVGKHWLYHQHSGQALLFSTKPTRKRD